MYLHLNWLRFTHLEVVVSNAVLANATGYSSRKLELGMPQRSANAVLNATQALTNGVAMYLLGSLAFNPNKYMATPLISYSI